MNCASAGLTGQLGLLGVMLGLLGRAAVSGIQVRAQV